MKYKLLCLDLDGTLLTEDKKIKKQDVEALQKAVGQGIQVALITNRMPAATEPIVGMLGIPCILACNAGTCIMEAGQYICVEYLPMESTREIYESIKSVGVPLWVYRNEQWLVTGRNRLIASEEEIIQYTSELVSAETFFPKWEEEGKAPNELLIGDEAVLIEKAYDRLKNRQDVDITHSSPNFVEILPKGVNKGKALLTICERKGIRREETIAFGDHVQDIPMLEAAGIAVAMGNAIDELKEKADFVTKNNNEAGVAYALSRYLC